MAEDRQADIDRELTICGDLMFSTVFHDRELCRGLIETLLSTRIKGVELAVPQRQMKVAPLSRAGIVDVLATDAAGNVFDVEMQNEARSNLSKRARYYGSLIDTAILDRGTDFGMIRDRTVIFVCSTDPFDEDLKRYTFAMTCQESGMVLPDGQRVVFANAQGGRGPSTPELDAFLGYLADGGNIGSDYVRRVDEAVCALRDDPVWRRELMLWELKYQDELAHATKEAREAGYAEGRTVGERDGQETGLQRGLEQGRERQLDELARLSDALERNGRSADLPRALRDPEFRRRLMDEYGVGTCDR